jgi:hypothetical protein
MHFSLKSVTHSVSNRVPVPVPLRDMNEERSKPKKTQMTRAEFNADDYNSNDVTISSTMDGHRPHPSPPIVNPPHRTTTHYTLRQLQAKWPEGEYSSRRGKKTSSLIIPASIGQVGKDVTGNGRGRS